MRDTTRHAAQGRRAEPRSGKRPRSLLRGPGRLRRARTQRPKPDEFTDERPACPNGSKVGTVKIKTPLLTHELEGSVYLASPAPNGEAGRNPFNCLIALYIVAEDPVSGVLVKLAGEGQVNEETLQISTIVQEHPPGALRRTEAEPVRRTQGLALHPQSCGNYRRSLLHALVGEQTQS